MIIKIQSASRDNGCGLFAYRMYEGFYINLSECSMYGYFVFQPQIKRVESSEETKNIKIFFAEINL